MGLLADLHLSQDGQAARYDAAPAEFPDRLESKGLTTLELSTVWALMRGVEWSAESMDTDFPIVMTRDEGEVMISRLPDAMARELAPFLEDMIRLARNATETGRSIYLWNSV
jgi:hypothetical protein